MPTNVNVHIEIYLDVETKQLAERAAVTVGYSSLDQYIVSLIQGNAPKILQEQIDIKLSAAQFDRFIDVCNAQHIVPSRLREAAQLLDKEGF